MIGEFVLEDVHNVTLWDLVGDLVMSARVVAHNGYLNDLTTSRCVRGGHWPVLRALTLFNQVCVVSL